MPELAAIAAEAFADGDFTIADDHPCLAGHFPGRPIVPGVMLLDEVFSRIRRQTTTEGSILLEAVKFTAPVLPGQPVRVVLQFRPQGRVGFACEVGDTRVMTGTAMFAAIS